MEESGGEGNNNCVKTSANSVSSAQPVNMTRRRKKEAILKRRFAKPEQEKQQEEEPVLVEEPQEKAEEPPPPSSKGVAAYLRHHDKVNDSLARRRGELMQKMAKNKRAASAPKERSPGKAEAETDGTSAAKAGEIIGSSEEFEKTDAGESSESSRFRMLLQQRRSSSVPKSLKSVDHTSSSDSKEEDSVKEERRSTRMTTLKAKLSTMKRAGKPKGASDDEDDGEQEEEPRVTEQVQSSSQEKLRKAKEKLQKVEKHRVKQEASKSEAEEELVPAVVSPSEEQVTLQSSAELKEQSAVQLSSEPEERSGITIQLNKKAHALKRAEKEKKAEQEVASDKDCLEITSLDFRTIEEPPSAVAESAWDPHKVYFNEYEYRRHDQVSFNVFAVEGATGTEIVADLRVQEEKKDSDPDPDLDQLGWPRHLPELSNDAPPKDPFEVNGEEDVERQGDSELFENLLRSEDSESLLHSKNDLTKQKRIETYEKQLADDSSQGSDDETSGQESDKDDSDEDDVFAYISQEDEGDWDTGSSVLAGTGLMSDSLSLLLRDSGTEFEAAANASKSAVTELSVVKKTLVIEGSANICDDDVDFPLKNAISDVPPPPPPPGEKKKHKKKRKSGESGGVPLLAPPPAEKFKKWEESRAKAV